MSLLKEDNARQGFFEHAAFEAIAMRLRIPSASSGSLGRVNANTDKTGTERRMGGKASRLAGHFS
jgi:hypothetical protein